MLNKFSNRNCILTILIFMISSSSYLFSQGVFNTSNTDGNFFVLDNFNGALVFQYQKTIEDDYNFDYLVDRIDRSYLEGGLELNFGGSIYHPNLLTFRVDLNLKANKSKNIYFSDESINDSLNNSYDIEFSFFKRKKINFQLYAQKSFATADRRFSERFFLSTKKYGLKLNNSNHLLPFRVDVYRNSSFSESFSYQERDEVTDNVELKADLTRITGSKTMFKLMARDYSESVYNSNYKSLTILANYINHYGSGERNSLSSMFSLRKMSGDVDQEVFRFDINHRHYLKSNLYLLNSYKFTKDNSLNRSGGQHFLLFSMNHQLFNSLDTKINSDGRLEDNISQKIKAFSFGPEIIYRKKIPGGGINIRYMNRRETGDYISKNDISSVSEIFRFSLSDSIILTIPGINPESISVTDNDLTILYIVGIDYRIDIIGTIVTITRIPGGAIPTGGRIRVLYDFLSFPDFNYTFYDNQLNINLNVFKYFHLFFRNNTRDQEIVSEFLVKPFQSFSKKIYGAKIISGLFDVEYMHEDYNSDISSYVSKNLRVSLGFNITKKLRLTSNASINRLEYDFENYFVNFDTYYGSLNFRPNQFIFFNLIYRDMIYETDNYYRERESIISKLQWNFRSISLELFYEYILNGFDEFHKSRNYFVLRLRRIF